MDEKGRFAVALAGVGSCLCLAAGIVISGPGDRTAPSVDRPVAVRVESLPRWPMPMWADVPAPTPQRSTASVRPRDLVSAAPMKMPTAATATAPVLDRLEAPPEHQQAPRSLATRPLATLQLVNHAPDAIGTEVVVARAPTRGRSAVAAALVTAGTHVGGSVKLAGRTLRRVF